MENMKSYIGTKIIGGCEMSRGDYYSRKNGNMPEGLNETDKGYLVKYPNYESWSPKDVFEESYREIMPKEVSLVIDMETEKHIVEDKCRP